MTQALCWKSSAGPFIKVPTVGWEFFISKAFVIMAVMMSGGIGLRVSGLASERFIAVFYTGLGASLLLAGLLFGRNFGKGLLVGARVQNKIEHKGD